MFSIISIVASAPEAAIASVSAVAEIASTRAAHTTAHSAAHPIGGVQKQLDVAMLHVLFREDIEGGVKERKTEKAMKQRPMEIMKGENERRE